ncbi:unnamed protein product [Pseudo-nitzschia multistriata]|uniref:Calcineurin-like phosphoesterase domain-containing protein n=1 Tax=Pseudo-nitzschia multistriata TaxID=183589 RepID=A0A448ZH75_9STRA|nr:unnamed protein product [Pseudo-nitzschia multistriata]
MVEISSPSSFKTLKTPRSRSDAPEKKPLWLLVIYALFFLVCLNAIWTYKDRKRLVWLELQEREQNDNIEIQYSAGAEQHVVSSNYGSSMYGGSIRAAESHKKKKKKKSARKTTLENILPRPRDGSKDYIIRKPGNNSSDFKAFSFYVMTDTPYTKLEEKRLRSQMSELRDYIHDNPKRNLTLGIHLGNTQKVSNSLCAESAYKNHAYLISKGPSPTFVTPGKSDWFDCPRREEAFDFFVKYMGPDFISEWHREQFENFEIQRSEENPELFTFYIEGILFIGLHMIDSPGNQESSATRNKRVKASMEWFANTIETNMERREIRGVIIMGHAGRSESNQQSFTHMAKYFVGIGTRENIPVMYLHGNGAKWEVDRSFSQEASWSQFYDVQVDQGGLTEPCIIDVAPQRLGKVTKLEKNENNNDMETIIANGLFRLDQQKGRYLDPEEVAK